MPIIEKSKPQDVIAAITDDSVKTDIENSYQETLQSLLESQRIHQEAIEALQLDIDVLTKTHDITISLLK